MDNYFNLNNNNQIFEFKYEEYYLIKDNIIYKTIIEKIEKEIIIKIKNYIIIFNLRNLEILTKIKFIDINNAYKFIIDLFEENKVIIKSIIYKKELKLNFIINNEKEIDIILSYKEDNKNIIVEELNKLKNEIKDLKLENNKFKKEIDILKSYHKNPNCKHIKLLLDINKDSYACTNLDNIFTVFKSINDILYLIYSNKNRSLICYDIIKRKIITEIKNCHNKYISNIRHYFDKNKNIDLILSISFKENNIKLWKVNNWECLLNLQNIYNNGYLDSACFLNDNNNLYIVASNYHWGGLSENIKVFDIEGNKIKEFICSNKTTYFIDSYYDKFKNKNYIITGNENYVKSYDFNNNKVYHKYCDNENRGHLSIIINNNNNDNIVKLIESCFDGNIRIWNFHSGSLLNKINVNNKALFGICSWTNDYILVGCEDKAIKLIDLNKGLIIQNLTSHKNWVISIKHINHHKYGELLISQGYGNDQIKIWINE